MSLADNLKFSRHEGVRGKGYTRYDNFDAIEIPFVDAIPADYDGVMGVPISFLDKHNPEQYELIGMSAYGQVPAEVKIAYKEGHHRPYVNDVAKYQRVLIRKKD